jgi:CheY-like chemotaxis protein
MSQTRTLVVDDDRDFAEALADILDIYGYPVDIVHNGEDAIETARTNHFDIILMDIALPGIDGIETLQRIQAHYPDVNALLMTGYDAHHLRDRAAGTEILVKPLNHDDLLQRIRQFAGADSSG